MRGLIIAIVALSLPILAGGCDDGNKPTATKSNTGTPASETLAFVRDGDIWLVDAQGKNERSLGLSDVRSIAWVTSEELDVVAGSDDARHHLLVDVRGTGEVPNLNVRELTFPAGGSWSRDGARYAVSVGASVVVFERNGSEVARLALTPEEDTGEKPINCRPPYESEMDRLVIGPPTLSPDGETVLVAVNCEARGGMRNLMAPVYEISLDGQINRPFANMTTNLRNSLPRLARFSPDGRRVAEHTFIGSNACGGDYTIYVVDDSSAARKITMTVIEDARRANSATTLYGGITSYDWAPESSAIVASVLLYSCGGETGGETLVAGLYVVALDGSEGRRIVEDPAVSPAWSPTGRYIAYVTSADIGTQAEPPTIHILDVKTLETVDIGAGSEPGWRPSATSTVRPVATVAARPTATPGELPPRWQEFRAFAQQIEEALEAGDASLFVDRAVERELRCAGTEGGGLCSKVLEPTVFRGIFISEFDPHIDSYAFLPYYSLIQNTVITRDEYASFWEKVFANARRDLSDGFGTGAAALYALDYSALPDAYSAVVTGIFQEPWSGAGNPRLVFELNFQFLDGRWQLVNTYFASANTLSESYDYEERWEGSAP